MNSKSQIIKNRLSLREPQVDSLEILEKLADVLELKKNVVVVDELAKVNALHPTCSEFERDFPSVCFALATGVGKTRLMGAFISYLFIAKGIKNFFVLAPNLTIYNKLIDDLSNPQNPKYVFRGISEFTVSPPRIITGDNYAEARQALIFKESININIFNISKINSEVSGGREPRIKRLSEYLGESYFNYLAGLPDLVLLMDESHHYRADAGLRALNELQPILGLELTATPIDMHGNKFKNVVFDYPLALALKDGFVKEPAVATRRNFNPLQYRNDPKEIDLIKLEDGVRIHEDTKVALDIYSRDSESRLVKPFILVSARDTDHAKEIWEIIESDKFFEGRYRGKVMYIHSNQRGEEKEENIQKLLGLEKEDNSIEIVIHVYMLKEGWDVTNLYTIVPLNASRSQILTEQIIGRGLRLPYGVRTGIKKIDTLTIIAHDSYQAIVDEANKPDSIIHNEQIIEIDPDELPTEQEVITVNSSLGEAILEKQHQIDQLTDEKEKQKVGILLEAEKMILDVAQSINSEVKNINDLKSEEIKKIAIGKMLERIEVAPQQILFKDKMITDIEKEYQSVINDLIEKTIPIPRILIQQAKEVEAIFHDFDLETDSLNYQPVSEELIRQFLRTNEREIITSEGDNVVRDTPLNIIVNELINYPAIEYDKHSKLLYKLAGQAISKLNRGNDKELRNIVLYHKREIAGFIYAQMDKHFELISSGFEKPIVYPYTKIESHNYTRSTADQIYLYTETITPTRAIPTKIFGGFKKSCHNLYKFDSKAEKDLAIILENDTTVLRWLRPALAQFSLYWNHNTQRYIPDFVVETKEVIYLIEIKAENQINDAEVREKSDAAKVFCEAATNYNKANGGKEWKYVLIPHNAVAPNMSLSGLI